MTRRLLLCAGTALALTLAPAAAHAYEAPGYEIAVSDVSPSAAEAFTVTLTGATPGLTYTLTATAPGATKTFTATADTDGVVTFTVTLDTPGTYTLATTDPEGTLFADAIVTVAAPGEDQGERPDATPVGDKGTTGGDLAETGFDGAALAVGAGALMAAGAGAVLVARRRVATTR